MSQTLLPPQPLVAEHRLEDFSCWEPSLDEWLRRRALVNQATGASRTFVVANESGQVLAYYALAAGAVSHQESPGSIRRNMPDPVPVMVLARLAVDQRLQGQQIGGALLKDALQRAVSVAQSIGVRALLVHAINEGARQFYSHYGFVPSPANADQKGDGMVDRDKTWSVPYCCYCWFVPYCWFAIAGLEATRDDSVRACGKSGTHRRKAALRAR